MVAVSPFLMLPLYMYPGKNAWAPLYSQVQKYPDLTFQVIVNPNSGPGVSPGQVPDSNWITALSYLNTFDNVEMIGYVHTDYATRNMTEVEQEIQTYAEWALYQDADIALNGSFFDEAPDDNSSGSLGYMAAVASYARAEFTGRQGHVVTFNPGAPVPDQYYDMADNIVAFESVASDYSANPTKYPLAAISQAQRSKSTFMINNCPNNKRQQKYVNNMVNNNVSGIWISNHDDYQEFSGLWTQLVSQVANC